MVQTTIVETFLEEFCAVMGVKKRSLRRLLHIVTCPSDNSILVVNSDDERDVKFGVKPIITTEENEFSIKFTVFGEYLTRKEDYPKTTKCIIENGGITGDIEVTSGE